MFPGFVFLVFAIWTFILKCIFSSHRSQCSRPVFFFFCFSLPLYVGIVIDYPHLFLVSLSLSCVFIPQCFMFSVWCCVLWMLWAWSFQLCFACLVLRLDLLCFCLFLCTWVCLCYVCYNRLSVSLILLKHCVTESRIFTFCSSMFNLVYLL